MLFVVPVSLLSATVARGNDTSSAPGITQEDQREERFYNFDHGRQSGGGFTDPSDLIQKLQNARNLQHATDPDDTLDAALEDFAWPDEHEVPPEGEQTVDSVANSSSPIQIPDNLFLRVTPNSTQEPTTAADEEDQQHTPPPTTIP
ncbi:MAG: hypothetical protein TH68_00170 [Candidatus Synechococcus spongiarum 142]|uniref:Uncharacterized protein n=1 Tax=Candidatus Synechococcus spongiarum 142 TaxID=1608213 RepID=A0A6N3X755_9SYNE|nr:MAG: hypothetical protein TH68_00170 [Candidatus Synechococcus spongiarum 142]